VSRRREREQKADTTSMVEEQEATRLGDKAQVESRKEPFAVELAARPGPWQVTNAVRPSLLPPKQAGVLCQLQSGHYLHQQQQV